MSDFSDPPLAAETSPPSTGRTTRPPRLLRRTALLLSPLLLLLAWIWYTQFHGTGWSQILNPAYWYHRVRGDDIYSAGEAFLMHGNRSLQEVAITFDDGPHPASREQILDALKRYGVHATFFDVGKNMALHPDLVVRTLAEGHEIANHSANHNHLTGLTPQERHREINDADITFFRITGRHLTLLRPPGMRYDNTVLADTYRLGYIVVGYTTTSHDFDADETSEAIARRTLGRIENGSILLLHDYPTTAAALSQILANLHDRGYRCVTISEMLAHLPAQARRSAEQFKQAHAD